MPTQTTVRLAVAGACLALATAAGVLLVRSGPDDESTITPIADIQGEGAATELAGRTVTTRGVVTAVYPTGGLGGYYLQAAGSGGDHDETPGASDAVFVASRGTADEVAPGDHVQVTGTVDEHHSLTQLSVDGTGLEVLAETAEAPEPTPVDFPADEGTREAHEGMLVDVSATAWAVTDHHDLNAYGSLGLAPGPDPLPNPTSVADPGGAARAVRAENAGKLVVLDDGAATNFLRAPGNRGTLPYLDGDAPVRVGAPVTFTRPVVLDYRHEAWTFQPTGPLTDGTAEQVQPVTIGDSRPAEATPQDVGGDLTLASFNVLNYFTTLGEEFAGCRAYEDREGNPVTTNGCAPRGAFDRPNLERQQAKIVRAINGLDASVVALEEIENGVHFGTDRDEALAALVRALNEDAGTGRWAYVESPDRRPPVQEEDVIRTAFIYQPAEVRPAGASVILTGAEAFRNAREPLAQLFRAVEDGAGVEGTEFLAIANHFKSKGSGSGPGNEDTGDGQGAANADRVAQAEALVDFAQDLGASRGAERIFLVGDFNAYEREDPISVLEEAGYASQGARSAGEYSYAFDGSVGSLDGIFASPAAAEAVTGVDVWMINANEPVALEYSRYNYTAERLYAADQWRSSDHNPILVGIDLGL
ncbi:MAG TPA: ExeM/NucH family extracellular endonuclease [Citricoccus sp.]